PGRITVSVDQSDLPEGTYSARIRIGVAATGGSSAPIDVPVSLTVKALPQTLEAFPSVLRFGAFSGSSVPQDQYILVRNRGGSGPIPFTVSLISKAPWLTQITQPANRTGPNRAALVRIRVNPQGLTAGLNRAVVRVASAAGNRDVAVTLFVSDTGSLIRVTPSGLRFDIRQGAAAGSSGRSIRIFNAGSPGTTVNWTAELVTGKE